MEIRIDRCGKEVSKELISTKKFYTNFCKTLEHNLIKGGQINVRIEVEFDEHFVLIKMNGPRSVPGFDLTYDVLIDQIYFNLKCANDRNKNINYCYKRFKEVVEYETSN